jgi:type I restriction enzyme S subunit
VIWPLVQLGDVAPAKASKHTFAETDDVWTLNLDQIEADTGKVLQKIIAPASEAGSSTHGFDERHVLYSKLRPYLNKVVLPNDKGLATTELVPMLPDADRLERKYLAYYLRSKGFVDWVSAQVAGAKMPRVSMQLFWQHEIPLPPLPEQKRIAAILDKADAIRRKRQQAIQLADDFLRAVFLDMFGDPATNPKGWPVYKMSEVIDFKGGSQPPKETFEYEEREGYIRLVQIRDFRTEKFKTYIPEHLARRRFEVDDVMIGRYGPPVFQILRGLSGSYNVALMKAIPKYGVTKDFIYRLLQLPTYQDAVISNSERTAGQTGVNLDLLNSLDVPLPPLEMQVSISKRIRKTEVLLSKLKLDLEGAEQLFCSLSQKAFSGKL